MSWWCNKSLTNVKANQLLELGGQPQNKPVAQAAPKKVFEPTAALFDFKSKAVAPNDFKRLLQNGAATR